MKNPYFENVACRLQAPESMADRIRACLDEVGDRPLVALVGDSHAGMLSAPLRQSLEAEGTALISFSFPGCLPIPGTTMPEMGGHERRCAQSRTGVQTFLGRTDLAAVILAGRWALNIENERFDNTIGGREPGTGLGVVVAGMEGLGPEARKQALLEHIRNWIVRTAASRSVVVVGQTPEAGWHVVNAAARRHMFYRPGTVSLDTPTAAYERRNAPFQHMMRDIKRPDVSFIDPQRLFCDVARPSWCQTETAEEALLYMDRDHLSEPGARRVTDAIMDALDLPDE